MVYNNTTTKAGIIQEIEKKTDLGLGYITGDSNLLVSFTADVNNALHDVWHLINLATRNWRYDDGNYTDLPSSTTDLVSGTAKYALPSEALTVQRIEIKDVNGNWYKLKPIVLENLTGALDEFEDVDSTPMYYKLINGTIELFPAPNYSQTDSLRVYYDRASVLFNYDDTTASPGFPAPYHEILPIKVAIKWLEIKQPQSPTLPLLYNKEAKMEKALKEHFSLRFQDYKPRIKRKYESFR